MSSLGIATSTEVDIVTEVKKMSAERQAKAFELIEATEERCRKEMRLIDGVEEVLAKLDALGIKKAIITKNSPRSVETLKTLCNTSFDCIVTRETGLPSKPSPAPFLYICKELRVSPENALMVGDHIDDVMCGVNANAKSILFCESQENIEKWGTKANFVARSMYDVLAIIESLAKRQ